MTGRAGLPVRLGGPLLVVALWGSVPAATRLGVVAYPPLAFAALRALLASLVMAVVVAAVYRGRLRAAFARLGRRDLALLAVLGLLQTAIFFAVYSVGVALAGASLAAILINTQPIFTVLLAHRLLGERLGWHVIAGLCFGFVSIPLVTLPGLAAASATGAGALLLLAGALSWSGAILLFKRTLAGRADPLAITAGQLWIGTAALTIAALALTGMPAVPDARTAASILYTAVLGTCVPQLLWFALLGVLRASYLSIFTFLMPVIGVALGSALLGERLAVVQLAGAAGVVLGVALTVVGDSAPRPRRALRSTSPP